MGRVYAVASAKGGVGKTTTTANLGVTLAAAGHRVAVVDADMGMPNLGRLLGIEADGPTLHDVLADDADPLDAVYEGPNGLSVVPGDPSLDAYAKAAPTKLGSVVAALSDYEIVLIDTGAGLSHDTVMPLAVADAVLLVSTPSPDALGDTEKTRQLAERVGVSAVGLVLTRADTADNDATDAASLVETRLIEVIPEDTESGDAGGDQLAVRRDGDSPVTAAYRALGDALVADAMAAEFEADAAAAADAAPDEADDAVDGDGEVADSEASAEATSGGDERETDDTTASDPSPADIDVSSVLDDPDDGLDTVLSVGDELAEVDDETGGEGDEGDEGDEEEEEEGDAATSDSDEAGDDETTASDSGGLASTLEAVEAGDDEEAASEDDTAVSDVVKEAEPDADDQGVKFDSAPEAADEGVTIEPEESLDVPDAEASDPDGDDADDGGDTADGANGDAADEEDEDEPEQDGEKKGGLFGRFFG